MTRRLPLAQLFNTRWFWVVSALCAPLFWTGHAAGQTPFTESSTHLVVHLELVDTQITADALRAALSEEFQMPVTLSEAPRGLTLRVAGRKLSASFEGSDGALVERQLDLPEDPEQQLTTVVLLSGNIARDESGALISALSAPAPPVPPPDTADSSGDANADSPVDAAKTTTAAATQKDPSVEGRRRARSDDRRPLPTTFASASLSAGATIPRDLSHKKTHLHVGLLSSNIGSLSGVGATLFVHRNGGHDVRGAGGGVQLAGLYSHNAGEFRGVQGSALVGYNHGHQRGVFINGLVGLHRGLLSGVQASGLVSWAADRIVGAQLAGLTSLQVGDVRGAQAAGLVSFNTGDFDGFQAAALSSFSTGKFWGAQLAALSAYAHRGLTGFQMSAVNVARQRLDGMQLGLVNVAGDFKGTQFGLINVGGAGKGTQVALLNIAKDLEGAAIAPVNIIPGMRNQLLTYVSYTPSDDLEGTPRGPLYHIAVKFLPGMVYTQLGFALGEESEECVDDPEDPEADPSCFGGGVVYAPSFAIGVHSPLTKLLYVDLDVQYQFVRGFSQSRSSSHQVLGRATVGAELTQWFNVFAGIGPVLEFYEGPRVSPSPEVTVKWHAFGGIGFF